MCTSGWRSPVQIEDPIVRRVFGLSEIDRKIYKDKVLTPEIVGEINQGKVITLNLDSVIKF